MINLVNNKPNEIVQETGDFLSHYELSGSYLGDIYDNWFKSTLDTINIQTKHTTQF